MTDQEIEQAVPELLVLGKERKGAFVIAKAAEAVNDDELVLFQVEETIKRLVAARSLETWGDVSRWWNSEVRLSAIRRRHAPHSLHSSGAIVTRILSRSAANFSWQDKREVAVRCSDPSSSSSSSLLIGRSFGANAGST